MVLRDEKENLLKLQPGLTLLLLCVLCAALLGGAFRVYFSSEKIRGWITQAINEQVPDVEFRVDSAQLILAQGIFPKVAIKIKGVEFHSQRSCWMAPEIKIDRLVIPLKWSSLAAQRVAFQKMEAGQIQLSLLKPYSPCAAKETGRLESEEKGLAKRSIAKSEEQRTNISFQEISADRIKFNYLNDIQGDLIEASLFYSLQKWRIEGALQWEGLPELDVEISGDDQEVKGDAKGNWREGQVSAHFDFDNKTQHLDTVIEFKHLPYSQVVSLTERWITPPPHFQPKLFWLSCIARLSGPAREIFKESIQIEQCKFEGDIGDISFEKIVLKKERGEVSFKPFKVKIADLQINELLKAVPRAELSPMLGSYGKVSGNLEVNSPRHIEFKGVVKETEFVFASQGRRDIQLLKEAQVGVELKDERVSGLLEQAQLEDGELEGNVSFNFSSDFSEGVIQLALKKILLAPKIQKLMGSGEVGTLALYGRMNLKEHQLHHAQVELGLEKVLSPLYLLNHAKVKAKLKKREWTFRTRIKKLAARKDSSVFELLKPLMLDHPMEESELKLEKLGGVLKLNENGELNWKKVVAYTKNKKVTFASKGGWNTEGALQGWVNVDFPNLKLLRWDLSGTRSAPKLFPSSRMLKEFAKKRKKKK